MTRDDLPVDGTLNPLFEAARFVEPVSDVARARSLARARVRAAAEPSPVLPHAAAPRASRRKVAVAVAPVIILMAATGVAAAFLGRAPAGPRALNIAALPVHETSPAPHEAAAPSAAVEPKAAPAPARRDRHITAARDGRAAELAVIRRAQAAYADDDYLAVLDIVAEHARRFPNGRLAEEAEALGVRSLAHCGRAQDALRALDAFAGRFPSSVLLPALRRSVDRERERAAGSQGLNE